MFPYLSILGYYLTRHDIFKFAFQTVILLKKKNSARKKKKKKKSAHLIFVLSVGYIDITFPIAVPVALLAAQTFMKFPV